MDDLLLPLASALAITALAQFIVAAFLAILRDLTLRRRRTGAGLVDRPRPAFGGNLPSGER